MRSDRGYPLRTDGDRCLWHVGGTAGEYDDDPHVTATVPGSPSAAAGAGQRADPGSVGHIDVRQTLRAADGS
jgi:hypothetical protein